MPTGFGSPPTSSSRPACPCARLIKQLRCSPEDFHMKAGRREGHSMTECPCPSNRLEQAQKYPPKSVKLPRSAVSTLVMRWPELSRFVAGMPGILWVQLPSKSRRYQWSSLPGETASAIMVRAPRQPPLSVVGMRPSFVAYVAIVAAFMHPVVGSEQDSPDDLPGSALV